MSSVFNFFKAGNKALVGAMDTLGEKLVQLEKNGHKVTAESFAEVVKQDKALGKNLAATYSEYITKAGSSGLSRDDAAADFTSHVINELNQKLSKKLDNVDDLRKASKDLGKTLADSAASNVSKFDFAKTVTGIKELATSKKRVEIDNLPAKLESVYTHLAETGKIDGAVLTTSAKTTPSNVMDKILAGKQISLGEWSKLESHLTAFHSKGAEAAAEAAHAGTGMTTNVNGKGAFFQKGFEYLASLKGDKKAEAHLESFLGKSAYRNTKSFRENHPIASVVAPLVVAGSLIYQGLESDKDKNDDNLSLGQRIVYNLAKLRTSTASGTVPLLGVNFGDKYAKEVLGRSTNDPVDLALQASLKESMSNKVAADTRIGTTAAEQTQAEALTAPPANLGQFYRDNNKANPSGAGASAKVDVSSKIKQLEEDSYVTSDEATSLSKAWTAAAKKPDPVKTFEANAKQILAANKEIGREPALVEELTFKLTK